MHIFKIALHYIKYYKLALNAFLKRNTQRYFLKITRLPQDLIDYGIYKKKYKSMKIQIMCKHIVCNIFFQVTFLLLMLETIMSLIIVIWKVGWSTCSL